MGQMSTSACSRARLPRCSFASSMDPHHATALLVPLLARALRIFFA